MATPKLDWFEIMGLSPEEKYMIEMGERGYKVIVGRNGLEWIKND